MNIFITIYIIAALGWLVGILWGIYQGIKKSKEIKQKNEDLPTLFTFLKYLFIGVGLGFLFFALVLLATVVLPI